MEALTTKTLELSPVTNDSSRARLFYGNYAYYLEKTGSETAINNDINNNKTNNDNSISDNQKSAMEQRAQSKQRQTEIRRLQRQEADLLNAIDEFENEKSRLEAELSLPAVYSNGEKARTVKQKLGECIAALKAKTFEWETVAALSAQAPYLIKK
jgi:ATP-binding cassette subfamily F protein 3